MKNDPRLSTKEQIQEAKKLLSDRKKWLKGVFISRLQEEFPEFEQSYIQSSVVAITEEDLEDYEVGEKINNTPLTDFEITLGKLIDLPDSKIDAAIKEIRENYILPNDFEEQCRKHRFADEIKWTDELLEKIKEINVRTTELLTELYEKSKILRNILNEEYEKGNKLFADFEITGQNTNHNLKLYPENIPINYYMHSVFMDGGTYNLYDMLNMKPEEFQVQITIRTWDYLPERENE